jgi:hypothetical protein
VTDVRDVVHVIDRRGDVEGVAHLWGQSIRGHNPVPRQCPWGEA